MMSNIRYVIGLVLVLVMFSGCEDRGYGTQDISVVPSVTGSDSVQMVDSIPINGGIVAQRAFLNVAFSSYIDEGTAVLSNVKLRNIDNAHEVLIEPSVIRNFLFIKPLESLVVDANYELQIKGLKDIFDNPLEQDYKLSFVCRSNFWEKVIAGDTNSMAKSRAGDLYIWGSNAPLPIDKEEKESIFLTMDMPMPIPNTRKVQSFSTGASGMAIVTEESELINIGNNAFSDFDNLIYDTVNIGTNHSVVLKQDGTIFSWGSNAKSQLGVLKISDQSEPIQEESLSSNWRTISSRGDFTLALKDDNTLWAWGDNEYGQAGGRIARVFTPTELNSSTTNVTDWEKISAGFDYSIAIGRNGTLWSWGNNRYGQLGDGNNTESRVPLQEFNKTEWIMASAGYSHTIAIKKADNSLWTWGNNDYGQLGDDSDVPSNKPVAIMVTSEWKDVSAGKNYTLAVDTNGSLWAWGSNFGYKLGIDINNTLIPMEVK